tara:strand:- start:241 stop:1509 length:1269 start_codon:yes stop_codon:yes gene_type:complete
MSTFSFILPAASQTLAVSRTNWNGSFTSVLQCFYGNQLPAATDINDEGTTGLVNGMLYRDSANGTIYIRDSSAFKGQSGHITGGFTRVGMGVRIFNTLEQAATLAAGHTKFSAIEVGELICTVGNSAGSANNRLYLKTTNTATGITDVGLPADGSITTAKLASPISLTYAANVTGNLSVTRSLAVGYTDGRVPQANLDVKNNVFIGGVASIAEVNVDNGSESNPTLSFKLDPNTGFYKTGTADQIGFTAGGTTRVLANTGGIHPNASTTYNLGGAANKWKGVYATNFFGQATSALYADLAERFEADEVLEEGDVVMIGGEKEITKTDRESTPEVFGVISTSPAYAMNADGGTNDTHPYVALAGRIPVKVVGKVLKGQRLVASSQTGIAIAAETKNIFAVVGRALESSDELGVKLIQAVVGKL